MKCPYEHAVYVRQEGDEVLIICVYLDDLLITISVLRIMRFKGQMSAEFEMSNLEKLTHYLGIEVDKQNGHTQLKQTACTKRLLRNAALQIAIR